MRAKNEMPHVQRTIDMLQRQSNRDYVLYAVDSGSEDGTLDALRKVCPRDRLTQIAATEYIPGRVLNHAIARTSESIVILLNADAVPSSDNFPETLLAPLLHDHADAVFARQVARPDARFVVAYDYRRAYDADRMDPDFFSAVACAFKRSLWERNHFRETGYAEDLAWARACFADGARIRFVPQAVVEHSHNYSLKALYRKRFRQAATFETKPDLARQTCACLREVARDLLHAMRMLEWQSIPYNVAYRVTIHAAVHAGIKSRAASTC